MSEAKRWVSLAAAGVLWSASPFSAIAQESLSDLEPFREGCQALADSRYGTASKHFQSTWEILEAGDSGEVEKEFVTARLLEALVKNEDSDLAVQWLVKNPSLNPSPGRLRWSAVALQEQHRFAEAAEAYTLLRGTLEEGDEAFALDLAVCQALSGEAVEAFDLVNSLPDLSTQEDLFRAVLVATKASQHVIALEWLKELNDSTALSTLNLQAWNLIQSGRSTEAFIRILESIGEDDDESTRVQKFLLLHSAEKAAGQQASRNKIQSWADDESSPLAREARLYLDLSEAGPDQYAGQLTDWLKENPGVALPGDDYLESFAEATEEYRTESFAEASRQFMTLSEEGALENEHRSLYNAALSALQGEDFETFLVHKGTLETAAPRARRVADLNYLAGLFRAARAESDALTYLQNFIRENPDHPKRVEAQLALAEIHLNQAPARPKAARQIFESLRTQPLTLSQNERLDYTFVWLELIDSNFPTFTQRAESFLKNWPGSTYFPEVSMLLAKQLYSEKSYEKANQLFETTASRFPDSDFADLAAFFAAKSSPPSEESIAIWQGMANADGPYAINAQHELGLLHLEMDQFDEARAAFETIIDAEASAPENRMAALADLGFTSYLEALTFDQDPDLLAEAAETFSRLSNFPDAPPHWRYSAALRRARCLEATGNGEVALEIYRSIVAGAADSGPGLAIDSDIRSQEWIFRAGFFAIRLFQEKEDWKAAIKMADDLSRKSGPRAIEASRLAEEMRLKHWVWD